jgi:uncharacterized protein (TIGR02246 family)
MDALATLTAKQEIGEVISRYALWFDDKNWEAFATLWAEDAVWAVEDGMAFEGRDALMGFLTTCLPDGYSGKHMISPPLVELAADGTSATAQTDVVWISQDFENRILARYVDDFVQHDGRWVFRRRTEVPIPCIPGPPPMSDTAMQVSRATIRA